MHQIIPPPRGLGLGAGGLGRSVGPGRCEQTTVRFPFTYTVWHAAEAVLEVMVTALIAIKTKWTILNLSMPRSLSSKTLPPILNGVLFCQKPLYRARAIRPAFCKSLDFARLSLRLESRLCRRSTPSGEPSHPRPSLPLARILSREQARKEPRCYRGPPFVNKPSRT